MDVFILESCRKELLALPVSITEEVIEAMGKLEQGAKIEMPLSRPLPTINKGLYEIRLNDKHGIYRVFYFLKKKEAFYMIHAFKKKTQKTPQKTISLVKSRIKGIS